MESTKKIALNSLLRVYKMGFGYSKLIVIDVNDYYIGTLAENDFFYFVSDGDKVQVYYWVEEVASYEFDLEIIGRIDSRNKILFFKHSDHVIKSKERKCLNADVDLPIKFFVFDTGIKNKKFSSEKVNFHYGTVVQLADRSALIRCSDELSDDLFYKGHVIINNEDVELVGKVKPVNNNNNDKYYKLSFSGINDKDRNKLMDYVFSIYRE